MKTFESEIKKYAEKTRLKAIEREIVRDRVLSYMAYHPLKKEHFESEQLPSRAQNDFIYIPWSNLWLRLGSGVLALFLIVGIPLLAERSVPGDVLYLVKTGVNEGVRTQLATSPYEKVELETMLMERRIAEARLLASEGKLTGEVEAQIAESVKGHTTAVQQRLVELRVDDAEGAALAEIVFNSALEVQSAVLDESESTSSSSIGSILDAVNDARDEVASNENPSLPSYEGLGARIESETTRAYELFESVKKSATDEEIRDIKRRLSDIDRSVVGAEELQETNEADAVLRLIDVLGLIQKLITFMTDIDVRETVELETLVPVIPTPEERTVLLDEQIAKAEKDLALIVKKYASIPDRALGEKVAVGIEEARSRIDYALEVRISDLPASEQNISEAGAFITDSLRLTEGILISDGEGTTTPVTLPNTGTSTATSTTSGTTTTTTVENTVRE